MTTKWSSSAIRSAVRIAGFALIAVAAVVVLVVMAPKHPRGQVTAPALTQSYLADAATAQKQRQSAIEAVDSKKDVNEISADSAPKQSVVNGWATVDLLKLIAAGNAEDDSTRRLLAEIATNSAPESDGRVPVLIGLAILAIAWGFCMANRRVLVDAQTATVGGMPAPTPLPSAPWPPGGSP